MMKRFTYLLMVVLIAACSSIDCPVDAIVQTKYQIRHADGTEHHRLFHSRGEGVAH